MRDTMLREQRDFALFQSYQKALEENTFSNQREAVDYVRTHTAPRWFVSKEFAAAVLSSKLRGKDHYRMGRSKRRKFDALFRLYLEKKQESPYCGFCHLALCEAIIDMPAPEWYLEHDTVSRIIKEQIKEINDYYARRHARR